MEALSAIGQTYREFLITQYLPLEELQSTLIELVHEPTGARVMLIANEDPENLFSLSFQTLPNSSNGVAHILEHIVLCGSRKFPIKDPFFAMTRRSLNTYMNALTGQDFTCYPASTFVEKDFYNLLEVYLDAVFNPHLKKESFLQEGHRFAFAEAEDESTELTFQGVVYNEMKGAMNSPDSRLSKQLGALLTPDLTYAHNSGGEPSEIPELTLEELREFHQTFYHPSRCLFFFYGNLPLSQHLDFLLTHVLEETKKIPQLPPMPLQKRFTAPVYAEGKYPIASGENPENKTMIAISWLTASIAEQTDLLGLTLLSSILMDTDASFLKKTLLRSGLCTQAECSLDLEMSEVPFTIVCKGCNDEAAQKLKTLCLQTLEKFMDQPIHPQEIETALHQLEFERTEIGAEGIPFGLTLFFRAALAKQQGVAPEHTLLIHSLFDELRNRLEHPSFLPDLIRKYILYNPHCVVLTMKADPHLEEKEREKELQKLQNIKEQMTASERKEVILESKRLSEFQEEQENLSLDCLPKVTLDDVPKEPQFIPLASEKINGFEVVYSDHFTNHILYADLLFDLPVISSEQLPLLSLYAHLFTELGCAHRSYEENLAKIQECTGGASASLSLYPTLADPNVCKPAFTIRIKALKRHAKSLFDLLKDFSQGVDLTDEKRMKEWLLQHATELQNRFNKNALNYAVQLGFSGLSSSSFVYNEWHGMAYFKAVQSWIKNDHWIEELKKIQNVLFQGPAQLILTCDEALRKKVEQNNYYGLFDVLSQRRSFSWKAWTGIYTLPKISSQAHFIASPVAFTAQTLRVCSCHDKDSPLLLIAAEALDNVFLHPEIREKGGAYGSGANYSPTTGNFYLYSYRDPNLSKTLTAFEQALEKMGNGDFDEDDLEEAKFGVIQGLDTPVPPGYKALTAYIWKRSGVSFEQRKAFRKAVLEGDVQEVAAAVRRRLIGVDRTTVTFLGSDLYRREKEKLSPHKISCVETEGLDTPKEAIPHPQK